MMSILRYIEGVAPDTEVTCSMRFGRSVTLSSGKSYNVFKNNFLDSVGWRLPAGRVRNGAARVVT
jgi:hypothetical protein